MRLFIYWNIYKNWKYYSFKLGFILAKWLKWQILDFWELVVLLMSVPSEKSPNYSTTLKHTIVVAGNNSNRENR